jgi:hypothetical protein
VIPKIKNNQVFKDNWAVKVKGCNSYEEKQ